MLTSVVSTSKYVNQTASAGEVYALLLGIHFLQGFLGVRQLGFGRDYKMEMCSGSVLILQQEVTFEKVAAIRRARSREEAFSYRTSRTSSSL